MTVELIVNGQSLRVRSGITVAAALFGSDIVALRTSVTGEPRGAVCGMGTCFECRVTVDGVPYTRACMTLVCDGMVVTTDA